MLEQALLTGTAAHRGPTLELVYPKGQQLAGRMHAGAVEKCEEEEALGGCYKLTTWEQEVE